MAISRDQAIVIFGKRYRSPDLQIFEVGQRERDVTWPYRPNSWFVKFVPDSLPILRSSQLFCVSRETGEILYDGPAFDEG